MDFTAIAISVLTMVMVVWAFVDYFASPNSDWWGI